jgi:MFS family permease
MLPILQTSWPLLLGVSLLMVGQGMQGVLLGVRGELEGFGTIPMSVVMTGYFAGFLLGARVVPEMIRRVGHIRVFAFLGSLISAGLILFPVLTDPISWTLLRLALGFCFCGVYIVAESWLNDATSNEHRGRALSLYLIAQMVGVVAAQAIFALGDAAEYTLFIVISVLVSLAFAPMLLSATKAPAFDRVRPISARQLWVSSPLSAVGVFLLGAVFSGMFGMIGVWGAATGLAPERIAALVAAIYGGGMVLQYPIGWLSDRVDRRRLIAATAALGALACGLAWSGIGGYSGLLVATFVIGGMVNPLYSLLLAHANDHLAPEDRTGAAARMLSLNGMGALGGPLVTGWAMGALGPQGFFLLILAILALMSGYTVWRMTRRAAPDAEASPLPVPLAPTVTTPITVQVLAEEWAGEAAAAAEPGNVGETARAV